MISIARRLAPNNLRIVLLLAVLIVFHEGLINKGLAAYPDEDSRSVLVLREKLKRIIQEESALQAKIKEDTQLAVRPFADYLLDQGSLHFFEYSTRLKQLKEEHMAIAKNIARLQREIDLPIESDLKRIEQAGAQRFPVYSGAPPFSNYDPSRFDDRELFPYEPLRTNLFRLIISVAILIVVFFPSIAVWKGVLNWRNKETSRIYPILTIPGENGRAEAFLLRSTRRVVR
jgi:hypothetical protein